MTDRNALNAEVLTRWIAHTERYEGRIPWLYLDIKGLVTIGAGVLVDPVALAIRLPLRHGDGRLATAEEIGEEWTRVKSTPVLAQQGAAAAARVTRLRLSGADLDALTWARLDSTVAALVRRWPALPSWPWQAQLAVCSWAWAVGAMAQGWPRFDAALHAQDWTAAAAECRIREAGNPGVAPRNVENRRLFLDAVPPSPTVPPAPPSDTEVMTDAQRQEVMALVHATLDQSTRDALADGYRRR